MEIILLCDHTDLDWKPSNISVILKKSCNIHDSVQWEHQWYYFSIEVGVRIFKDSSVCQKHSVSGNYYYQKTEERILSVITLRSAPLPHFSFITKLVCLISSAKYHLKPNSEQKIWNLLSKNNGSSLPFPLPVSSSPFSMSASLFRSCP